MAEKFELTLRQVPNVQQPLVNSPRTLRRRKRPHGVSRMAAGYCLDLGLLRNLQSIIHLDAQIPDGTLQLGMTKQQLNGPQVLRAFVD